MTLDQAISNAFGLSKYVRRGSWPLGTVAAINVRSDNPLNPISTAIGPATRVPYDRPTQDDLQSNDWYPCDVKGAPPLADWRGMLRIGTGRQAIMPARGDQCTVRLNGQILGADWTLAWMTPYNLWLSVGAAHPVEWPVGRRAPLLIPLSVNANGVDMFFRLHDARTLPRDGDEHLYRLEVTLAD